MRYLGKTGKSPLQLTPLPPAHLLPARTFSMLFGTFPSTILPNFKTTRFSFLFAIFEPSLTGLIVLKFSMYIIAHCPSYYIDFHKFKTNSFFFFYRSIKKDLDNSQNRVSFDFLFYFYWFFPCQTMVLAKLKYENSNVLLKEIEVYRHNNFAKCQGDPVLQFNQELLYIRAYGVKL